MESLMDTLVDRRANKMRVLYRSPLQPTRRFAVFGEPIKVARAPEEPVAATKLIERLRIAVESLA